jgi:hypothetical protein
MTRWITTLYVVAALAAPALAETETPVATGSAQASSHADAPTPSVTTDVATTTEAPPPEKPLSEHYGLSLGAGQAISKFHFGLNARAQFAPFAGSPQLKLGAETGFYFGPGTPETYFIPFLATVEYTIESASAFIPTIALELGFDLGHASNEFGSLTGQDPVLLLVPGARVGKKSRFFIELPVGIIAATFTLLPRVGIHF